MACRYCQSSRVAYGVCPPCRKLLVHGEMDGSQRMGFAGDYDGSSGQLRMILVLSSVLVLLSGYIIFRYVA